MLDLLRNVSIFESASDDVLGEVAQCLRELRVERGEAVCRKGEQGQRLYLISEGQVRVSLRGVDGREETLGFLGPGDCFGEMSLITGEPISADVTASMPTAMSTLEGQRFTEICNTHPILYRGISRTLSRRLRETNLKRFQTRLGRVTRIGTDQAVADWRDLLRQMVRIGMAAVEESPENTLVFLPLPKKRLLDKGVVRAFARQLGVDSIDERMPRQPEPVLAALLADIKSEFPDHTAQWYSVADHLHCILWGSPWGGDTWDSEKDLTQILLRLKPVYRQILVSQLGWDLESLLKAVPPDDHLAFFLDFRPEDSQVNATNEQYERYVPEANRYPRKDRQGYWVLSPVGQRRMKRLSEALNHYCIDTSRVHILALHQDNRPLLDYASIRLHLPASSIHVLPEGKIGEDANPGNDTDPTISLRLGRQPERARRRVARALTGHRIGLALGGGGARGLAHIGVIEVLEKGGIDIDLIAGSSFGAVVAAAYAVGRNADRLVEDMRHHWSKLGNFLLDFLDYSFPRTSILRGRKIRRMIDMAMRTSLIEECQIPIFVVCTDLITGKEAVLERGHLGNAIFASGSLPGIFRPVEWGNQLLVDGAVLNKVPARILVSKGADIVVAVNVTPERDQFFDSCIKSLADAGNEPTFSLFGMRNGRKRPNILRIISRSLSVSGLHYSRVHSDDIDVEIKPLTDHFDFLRFDQYDAIVEAGREAARVALPRLHEVLANRG